MNSRVLLAVVLVVVTAGCTGGGFAFDASPATVSDDALDEAGYDGEPPEAHTVNETIEVAGMNADVTATTWTAVYSDDQGASLVVVSTPNAEIAGQSLNPLTRLSNRELVERALDQLDNADAEIKDVREVDSEQRSILGQDVEVITYLATAESDHGEMDVNLHLATVQHEDDVVIVVGIHPEQFDERTTILDLMEAIQH